MTENFIEVYVNAPLEFVKKDVKGLYAMARAGDSRFYWN